MSETHVFEIKRDSWFSSESRTTKLWKPLHFQHFCAGEMKYFQQYSFHMHIAQCTCPAHSSTIIAAATTTTTITTIANYLWIFTYEARIIDRHTNIHTIIQKRVFFMLAKNCIVFLGSGGGVCFFFLSLIILFVRECIKQILFHVQFIQRKLYQSCYYVSTLDTQTQYHTNNE